MDVQPVSAPGLFAPGLVPGCFRIWMESSLSSSAYWQTTQLRSDSENLVASYPPGIYRL
jgi:hypothetical protein